MKKVSLTTLEFIINWFWIGTIEKIVWSLCITEIVLLANWTFGGTIINKEALDTIASKALDYFGWAALININLFLISHIIIKPIFKLFKSNVPDEWHFS